MANCIEICFQTIFKFCQFWKFVKQDMEQPKQKIVTGFGLFKSVNTLVATPKNLDDLTNVLILQNSKNLKLRYKVEEIVTAMYFSITN